MTTPRIEDDNKFSLVHTDRYFGKSYDTALKLYHEIQKADKTILFKTPKGDVHILPNDKLEEIKAQAHQAGIDEAVDENTSDGYHTFKELYEFRLLYNAHLFNEWAKQGMYDVHKSTKHSDGEDCFGGGWFIVVASLPSGDISNHYEMKDWDLFQCEARDKAKEWDGHTSQDVATRLRQALDNTIKALQNNK